MQCNIQYMTCYLMISVHITNKCILLSYSIYINPSISLFTQLGV
ncbi:hypothetical protein F383_19610 [Gossypium arboreum]|uniref:Uncharacterized protein n=1 Tax=Gossypium arboreum TaxID=29729 RepID=A0A0B0NWE9_GOSAR|nr:hypothetical protein F383_19610 [Gossypium arboreum]